MATFYSWRDRSRVLIVSSDGVLQHQIASRVKEWYLDATCCCTMDEALHVLTRGDVFLIFCADRLVDGDVGDLLGVAGLARPGARVVVTVPAGREPDFGPHARAKRSRVYHVLRAPCRVTEIDDLLVQVLREENGVTSPATT